LVAHYRHVAVAVVEAVPPIQIGAPRLKPLSKVPVAIGMVSRAPRSQLKYVLSHHYLPAVVVMMQLSGLVLAVL
jgi:hypothetical protein